MVFRVVKVVSREVLVVVFRVVVVSEEIMVVHGGECRNVIDAIR